MPCYSGKLLWTVVRKVQEIHSLAHEVQPSKIGRFQERLDCLTHRFECSVKQTWMLSWYVLRSAKTRNKDLKTNDPFIEQDNKTSDLI
jgi:hypothetical protein